MSRDLDIQCAEALGYAVLTGVARYDDMDMPYEVWITDPARKDEDPYTRQDVTINPIAYSSDLSAAWQLIDHMRAQGWYYSVADVARDMHEASFWRKETGDICRSGSTPAEAIAVAFLAAVGGTS